jgi:hypothetical protein
VPPVGVRAPAPATTRNGPPLQVFPTPSPPEGLTGTCCLSRSPRTQRPGPEGDPGLIKAPPGCARDEEQRRSSRRALLLPLARSSQNRRPPGGLALGALSRVCEGTERATCARAGRRRVAQAPGGREPPIPPREGVRARAWRPVASTSAQSHRLAGARSSFTVRAWPGLEAPSYCPPPAPAPAHGARTAADTHGSWLRKPDQGGGASGQRDGTSPTPTPSPPHTLRPLLGGRGVAPLRPPGGRGGGALGSLESRGLTPQCPRAHCHTGLAGLLPGLALSGDLNPASSVCLSQVRSAGPRVPRTARAA